MAAALLVTLAGRVSEYMYPSFIWQSFQPAKSIEAFTNREQRTDLRKALWWAVYRNLYPCLSATPFHFEQLDFMRNKDMGFDKEEWSSCLPSGQDAALMPPSKKGY